MAKRAKKSSFRGFVSTLRIFVIGFISALVFVSFVPKFGSVLDLPLESAKAPALGSSKVEPASFHPVTAHLIERGAYTLAYDGRNRNPFWVYELLKAGDASQAVRREQFRFSSDPKIPSLIQSKLDDYKGSRYDRGHMVPAADRSSSFDLLRDTFYLSNICPQNPELNRNMWRELETYVRGLAKKYTAVHVYTGPLYAPKTGLNGKRVVQYEVIGPHDVAVPTHFFKVLFKQDHKGSISNETYIIPNEKPPKDVTFKNYKTTLMEVQKLSGIIFQKH